MIEAISKGRFRLYNLTVSRALFERNVSDSASLIQKFPFTTMEMDLSFWLQLAVVLVCVAIGGRLGGVGLGAAGGLGVCILVLGMGIQPGSPSVSVLLIITAVIACTSVLQGSGGLDLLVRWAARPMSPSRSTRWWLKWPHRQRSVPNARFPHPSSAPASA